MISIGYCPLKVTILCILNAWQYLLFIKIKANNSVSIRLSHSCLIEMHHFKDFITCLFLCLPQPEVEVTIEDPESTFRGIQRTTTKQILKDISMYFNPGEMIGIMGPSGCGKTTFMDLLTGRRKTGMQTVKYYRKL